MTRPLWWLLLLMLGCAGPSGANAFDGIRVTLLGTGGIAPSADRSGPATLVEAGDEVLLFDCGRGTTQRLAQAGVGLGEVNAVFLTHLGADSTVGLPDIWLTRAFQRHDDPLVLYGPAGTQEMAKELERAFRSVIGPPAQVGEGATGIDAHDIAENVVYRSEQVTVTAIVVERGGQSAYSYRVDLHHQHSIVISSASSYSDNLVSGARGARLIVQEVGAADAELAQGSALIRGMLKTHSSPEDAARIFRGARPYLAVYAPIELVEVSEEQLMRRTHAGYSGVVELGHDLLVIEIQDEVQLRSAPSDGRREGQ